MKVEELVKTESKIPPPLSTTQEDYEATYDDDQLLYDIRDGMALLASAKVLIDFLSDRQLKRTLNMSDRDTMGKLSEKIRAYLVETEATYNEEEI